MHTRAFLRGDRMQDFLEEDEQRYRDQDCHCQKQTTKAKAQGNYT